MRHLIENFRQDLRFEARQLRRSPGFAVTAVFTVALGICASVAIFAFVDAALIKPLPYPAASRLVGVFESVEAFPRSNLSYLDYLDWKRLNTAFTSLSAYQGGGMTLSTPDGARRAPGARVSDDFFRTLGVTPVVGRDFRPGEDLTDAPRVAILSYAAWQARYGGRPEVLGQTVTLNGAPNVIVGVLPRDFHFAPTEPADFWTTLHPSASGCEARRGCHNLYGVARLAPGVSVSSAASRMRAIAKDLERQYPDSNRGQGAVVIPLSDVIVGDIRRVLLVLLGGAGLLLLIATVNVSSLLLVRAEGRKREIAVRSALGASTARVVRQFAAEALVLVTISGALGVASAYWATRLLLALVPANIAARMPYLHGLGINARVLLFASVVSGLAALLFAITPIAHLSMSRAVSGLTASARGSAGVTWRRVGSRLVIVELVTAMVLLVGAGLLGQSLYRLLHVDLGMQVDRLASVAVALPAAAYGTNEKRAAVAREVLARVGSLPGVQSAGISSRPPLQPGNTMWIKVEGRPYNGEHNEVHYRNVTAGYFSTLQARLERGRYFIDADDASRPPVVIINAALARQYFAGEDPLGRRLNYAPTSSQPPMEIVGVVDDVKEGALDAPTPPTMYVSFPQDPASGFAVLVRTAQAEETLLPAITDAIRRVNPDISTFGATTMRSMVNDSQAAYLRRSSTSVVGGFAVVAWLLVVVGLYGVVAYSVSQRTREIGIRMALGAQRAAVHRLIVREAAMLTATGLAIGALISVAAATTIGALLFGVSAWDLPTVVAAGAVLGGSAITASYIPAWRAARLDPSAVLRAE